MILNRKLTLEEAAVAPDGAGGFTETWSSVGEIWAHVKPGTGREKAQDFVTLSTVPYRITVRAAPDGAPSRPKPNQRFRDGSRLFRIRAVAEANPDARYLVCFAQEEVSA
ncbi:MAG: head-tail adaptor protein [Pseudomonadota bacterium]